VERDPLSDVLQSVRLTGAVFLVADCAAPWAVAAPPSRELPPSLVPGAEHVFEFHAVVAGSCWATPSGGNAVRVDAGGFVAFPRGEAHALASAPGLPAVPDPALFARAVAGPLPMRLRLGEGDGPRTRVVCGFLGCDARPFNPLLAALPRVLHASGGAGGAMLSRLVELALDESGEERPGSASALARLSELMFIDIVRAHVASLPPGEASWLGGLRDPFVGRAIGLLHATPARPWSLDALAREVGLSRSALAERFTRLAGEPPMHYLARWRMQLATHRLSGGASVQEAAAAAGYASDAAFSRAFKRVMGSPPASWAGAHRAPRGEETITATTEGKSGPARLRVEPPAHAEARTR
jgi:AraC-like DNA-binding protein